MKFLCLHGAIGNPENFSVQLDPFIQELSKDGVEFHFAQGGIQVYPSQGFEEYFGPGPHYRFFQDAGLAEKAMLDRVRDFPEYDTPEDTLRGLIEVEEDRSTFRDSRKIALQRLYDIIDKDDDIQGIIGYSEGAVVAGTLLLDEQHRLEMEGREKRLKCALFFAGWPPLDVQGLPVFSDETDTMIDAHSIHVIGANDPYISGSMSLYNDCNEDTAVLFDHGKGHTLPRDPRTLRELADSVRLMMSKAGVHDRSGNSSDLESVDYPSD